MSDQTSAMPDPFDRAMGLYADLPDALKTEPSTFSAVPMLGVGGSTFYTVQTIRLRDEPIDPKKAAVIRFVTFLIVAGPDGYHRHVLPDEVTDRMLRQRDSLGKRAQHKHGVRLAAERKAAGLTPGFMKNPARRKAGKKR